MLRKGFTMIELIFVIVILGILSKFGVDLLAKIYENYVFSGVQNRLQNESEMAVRQIANRLQYRIKDSVIARAGGTIFPIGNAGINATVLEWIGMDIDGWRGRATTNPDWSGFIDLDSSSAAALATPGTTSIPTVLGEPAIFFIGSNVDLTSNFGWGPGNIGNQNASIHPVQLAAGATFTSSPTVPDDFSGVDVYEYYQLARSAYAVSLEGNQLFLYYNYQPWNGGSMATAQAAGNKVLLMENVDTFKFRSRGDTLQVQVCVTENNITGQGAYAICKEKTIF